MTDARDTGKAGLPACSALRPAIGPGRAYRFAGLVRGRLAARRPRGAWRFSAVMSIAGALPLLVGVQGSARSPSVIVCAGYASCAAHGHTSHGYPAHAHASYWRMFAGNNCTNYVAYVESAVFRVRKPRYLLGNAGQWPATAAARGVTVNHVPSVGAVAEWDGGAPGMGPMGHVAVVEQVGPHDRYIVISQQHIGSDPNGYDWTRINAGFPARDWQEWPDHFIHFRVRRTAAVGYYNPHASAYRLQAVLGQQTAAIAFRGGQPGTTPLAGDWTGRGVSGTGNYDPHTGWFHLRSRPSGGSWSRSFKFGPPGMVPLAGNWDGRHGTGVGYYDPGNGTFHLRNYLGSGRAGHTFTFGPPGMVPLAGNWDGRGGAGIGYYNPATGWFHLRNHLSAGRARYVFKFGPKGMKPLAGNWDGGRSDGIGFYDPAAGSFHLRDHLSAGKARYVFRFGPGRMVPLAGDWTGP